MAGASWIALAALGHQIALEVNRAVVVDRRLLLRSPASANARSLSSSAAC